MANTREAANTLSAIILSTGERMLLSFAVCNTMPKINPLMDLEQL